MKQITAIIRPHRLEAVVAALHALPHLSGFTAFPALGHPRGHGPGHGFVPDEWDPSTHSNVVLLVFCADAHAPALLTALQQSAYTGLAGDGVVGVVELEDVLRIRTGERGDAAL